MRGEIVGGRNRRMALQIIRRGDENAPVARDAADDVVLGIVPADAQRDVDIAIQDVSKGVLKIIARPNKSRQKQNTRWGMARPGALIWRRWRMASQWGRFDCYVGKLP